MPQKPVRRVKHYSKGLRFWVPKGHDKADERPSNKASVWVQASSLGHPAVPKISSTTFRTSWEFPKIRGTLFGGPYNKDPTI